MRIFFLIYLFFVFNGISSFGQNKIDLKADFDIENREIKISQTIQYKNTSQDTLQNIYLNDWNNSYSTKKTALAIQLADEYINDFHLAKNEDRGYSVITSIKQNNHDLTFSQLKDQIDVIEVALNSPLLPNESYYIKLEYIVKVPSDKFTSYGITPSGDFNLRYWYITPAVYNGTWQYFSNKNLDDLYIPKSDLSIEITYPKEYYITSELNVIDLRQTPRNRIIKLQGNNRLNNKLFLNKLKTFESIETQNVAIVSNIDSNGISQLDKVLATEKVVKFMLKNLGDYPHEKLLLTEIDNLKDPVYSLNFLPKFIHTYPDNFKFELKILKNALHNYLENTLLINPRKEQWLINAMEVYFLMKYVEVYYPDMKFLGNLANIWGIRSFHASDLYYNEKYTLAYMLMARSNRDQPITMAQDSLIKFNFNIAGKYKAGAGLKYLDDFINHNVIENALNSFLDSRKLKETSGKDFELFLKSQTSKNIDWFFKDYLNTREKIDFKIKNVKKSEDSITLTIINKRENSMPVSLYALQNDSILSKTWIENITDSKTITIPRSDADKLVLNYNLSIPEYNLRDNWKSLKGFFFNNKPLQFRVFKDIEDPYYNQVFLMPIIEFNNIYDGLTLGTKFYNGTLLRKPFNYKISPQYSLGSSSITGSATAYYIQDIENNDLFYINYGLQSSYKSYAEDLFVRKIIPSVRFLFRDDHDFRSNKRQSLYFRYIDIKRDEDLSNISSTDKPNYSVFNARYINSNDNLINFSSWYTDFQVSKTFSKLSFEYEYRKLFESNRQLNLRVFAGVFLENKNDISSNYFSFALDRPTDYLFDYNYLGRSESTGIFSQQYIDAEGGFKSKLDTPYANQWMTTFNTSTTLWKYVLAYGDVGFVKNKFNSPKFVYDAGIRINLVTDYFEIFLPVYSNLGWEIDEENYSQRIRFKFTVDPKTLFGLFRRRWF